MRRLMMFVVLAALVAGGYVAYRALSDAGAAAVSGYADAPELTKEYNNTAYGFSLKMPADFSAQEIENPEAGATLLLQNSSGDGVQIVITPFDEDTGGYTLTKERILEDIPDMRISAEQVVEVGPQYKGIAFKSDNDSFGGASRDVWFVFNGNLYQISTYERLDPLLQAMFGTWQFQ